MEVAQRIADLPRDLNDNPLQRVPITARLERREVPAAIASLESGPSGEILTGPDKPAPFDPKNILWKAPTFVSRGEPARPISAGTTRTAWRWPWTRRGGDRRPFSGSELAARADPAGDRPCVGVRARDLRRRSEEGRFEIDAGGSQIGPPTGGGAPVEVGGEVSPPPPRA